MPEHHDVVVVGGGTAGCVLAARLSEQPDRTVCLVEAGPDYGAFGDARWPGDMLDARTLPMSHLWETEAEDRSASRARIIGGCSAHNACLVVWGSRADYDEWGDGWTFAELEPYLQSAERTLSTRRHREGDLTSYHRALLDAGPRVGLPPLDDLNDLDATVGIAVAPVNARNATRWNTSFAYLDEARQRPNLTVLADTLVDRVTLSHGRADGVLTDRGPLAAGLVVLAAGAYGSPAVLLRSGFGPRLDLERLGVGVVQELPVGQGLTDHSGVGMEWAVAPDHVPLPGQPVFSVSVVARGRSHRCSEGTWDIHLIPFLDHGERGWQTTAVVYLLKPDSRGSVGLRSVDPRIAPAIDHGFLADSRDLERIVSGLQLMRALAVEAGTGAELRPGVDADPVSYVRREVRGIFHPTGTCAIGTVVDASGAVLGADGLVVADASIIPTIPRANTNLTTVAIAERIADLLDR